MIDASIPIMPKVKFLIHLSRRIFLDISTMKRGNSIKNSSLVFFIKSLKYTGI